MHPYFQVRDTFIYTKYYKNAKNRENNNKKTHQGQ